MNEEIAILCIGTGCYSALLPGLLCSVRKYFLPEHSKRFYVFTDCDDITGADVCRVARACHGWPADTLERYGMFIQIADELRQHAYIYFFNANMRPVAPIGREVLPSNERPLVAVKHPRCFSDAELAAATETHRSGKAYIARLPYSYVAGGFNGGKVAAFLDMAAVIDSWQRADAAAGLVPPWHDESYLNAYRVKHAEHFRILPPSYLYPEGWCADYPVRILCLDKLSFYRKNFR